MSRQLNASPTAKEKLQFAPLNALAGSFLQDRPLSVYVYIYIYIYTHLELFTSLILIEIS